MLYRAIPDVEIEAKNFKCPDMLYVWLVNKLFRGQLPYDIGIVDVGVVYLAQVGSE